MTGLDEVRRASYDLHLHTCWSYDATNTVQDLLAAASQAGLRRIAITDHHLADGIAEAIEAAADYPEMVLVPGVELNVTTSVGSVHLLALGLTVGMIEALKPVWDTYRRWQIELGSAISAGVSALGFDYSDQQRQELLESYRPARTISAQGPTPASNKMRRAFFIERGYVSDEQEYQDLIAAAARAVPTPRSPSAESVLPAVKEQGALLVIAHPPAYFDGADRNRMEMLREELLLDGVECAHRKKVPHELTPVYRAWCEEHDLISTAGSDLHWPEDVSEGIGAHIGAEEWWQEIEARLPADNLRGASSSAAASS